jgi:hypothetical protein
LLETPRRGEKGTKGTKGGFCSAGQGLLGVLVQNLDIREGKFAHSISPPERPAALLQVFGFTFVGFLVVLNNCSALGAEDLILDLLWLLQPFIHHPATRA